VPGPRPRFRGVSHRVAFYVAVAADLILVANARDGRAAAATAIYGVLLAGMFGVSATLHRADWSPRAFGWLRRADHAMIFAFIAGTYTPFTLVTLRGGWGWSLFSIVWALAMAGIVFKFWFVDHFKNLSTALYLAMGWIALIALKPLLSSIPPHGMYWLLAGGLLYSIGVAFFAARRLPFAHAIWHVFVIAGSACHYFAVLFYVILRYRI